MLTSNKTSNNDNQGEALKPSTTGLLEAIENGGDDRPSETKYTGGGDVHVDLLMELTVKKTFFTSS
jgi:hypothetical protein